MGKEILAIPEEKIMEVVQVIRGGIEYTLAFDPESKVSSETVDRLIEWCDSHEEHWRMLQGEE